ncbi:MAG: hypothetical protein LQ346_007466 [Caloplaca aetnensis]|nr:MAG: hypothetical protein LQ346_007466 [Caloplaca aetnensis]
MTATTSAVNGHQMKPELQRAEGQPENPFASLIPDQHIAVVPHFTLESGVTLHNVPVAYSTRGALSPSGDNALVICHALSGSADVSDWWGPLMGGDGRAFDVTRFFIVCLNSLGSPYGSASPVTSIDGDPQLGRYGPEFPLTTIRDDVNIHKIVLDDLGVRQIAAAVGGSMGGMLVLEYAYFGTDYVRSIVPIATSSRHSAWGISWGEAQRQAIYCDPKYEDGYYTFDDPPSAGLGAARMSALLTYRSRDSFEARFGRNIPDPSRKQPIKDNRPSTPTSEHWAVHNDGHRSTRMSPVSTNGSAAPTTLRTNGTAANGNPTQFTDPQFHGATALSTSPPSRPPIGERRATTYFSAQSYLRYQGQKFVKRFDSNCYIAITRKLDTHDVSRHRVPPGEPDSTAKALSQIQQPALVIGIESDGLFTYAEQQEIAAGIPNSRLRNIDSPEGHDAFLLQFEQVNAHILEFFNEVLPDIMSTPGSSVDGTGEANSSIGTVEKTSTFGEAEVGDITCW